MEWVDFAKSKTWKITDNKVKEDLFHKIGIYTKTKNVNMFPGAHPVSIERKHFPELREDTYWVCAKSDGIRYLFVCVMYNEQPYSFFINRNNDIFLLNCKNEEAVFNTTILDGEMIFNTKHECYEFIVYDCIAINGNDVSSLHHSERLKQSHNAIQYMTNRNKIHFDVKMFYPLKDIKHYVQTILPTLNHNTDGLIFTPECIPVTNGTHFKLFKWKAGHENTVDFSVHRNIKGNDPKYILKVLKGKYLNTLFDNHLHVDANLQEELNAYIENDVNCIMECKFIKDNNWKAIKIRKDKSYPNNWVTYTKTLLNIQENIQLHEFFEFGNTQ